MSEYKPGTVATATVLGAPGVRLSRYDGGWARLDDPDIFYTDKNSPEMVTDIRPLVVLDLDESVGKGSLPTWLRNNVYKVEVGSVKPTSIGKDMEWLADQIEAQTLPPRIPEPGWGEKVKAHVEGERAAVWLRYTTTPGTERQWVAEFYSPRRWDDLIDPEALS